MFWKIAALLLLVVLLAFAVVIASNRNPTQFCVRPLFNKERLPICVDDWWDIPAAFFSSTPSASSAPREKRTFSFLSRIGESQEEASNAIYRYRDNRGRTRYTNIWDEVPAAYRERVEVVDLSDVTLNTQVGKEIEEKLSEDYEKLVESDYCKRERARSDQSFFSRLWSEYRIVVIIAGVILLLIVMTPFALRRINAPDWSRTLTMAIQMLVFLGIVSYTAICSSKKTQDIREKVSPCNPDAWTQLNRRSNPIAEHMILLKNLQNKIDMIKQESK